MKRWKFPGLAILGMAFLALLLSTCQKEELMLQEGQQLELREKKCTKTETKTTIEVNVPKDASAQAIKDAVTPALQGVIDGEKNPVVKYVLQNGLLPMIPGESITMSWFLSEPDVQALTRPFFLYATVGDRLYIVVVNIILIEDGADARAKEHEKGHEYIANEIAKKCAEKASKESGADCADAANAAATTARLEQLNQQAQTAYDQATQSGQTGDQMKEAREAARAVIEGYLGK